MRSSTTFPRGNLRGSVGGEGNENIVLLFLSFSFSESCTLVKSLRKTTRAANTTIALADATDATD